MKLDPARTAAVAIDMHRGHLDPVVATLPLAAERCGPVIERTAALFAALRERRVPVVHMVTEDRDAGEIAANPFWKAAHDDPGKARRGIKRHNLAGRHRSRVPVAPAAGRRHADPGRDQHHDLRPVRATPDGGRGGLASRQRRHRRGARRLTPSTRETSR
jgi:nicotinamidase-related amidase